MKRHRSFLLVFLVTALFFVSGATGLVYEIAWTRFFTVIYGNTTYGVSAVLTAFMAGLGFGSYFAGRRIDRMHDYLLVYALLEFGIAIAAFCIPSILDNLTGIYAVVYNWAPTSVWLLQVLRTFFSLCVLLIPTFLLGATLPVLVRFITRYEGQVGAQVGILYSVNTLGAVIGCFITGFFLIKWLGLRNTTYLAAVINLVLAGIFMLLRHGLNSGTLSAQKSTIHDTVVAKTDKSDRIISAPRRRLLLITFAFAGFTSLAYEVLWFRLLVFYLKTTIYAFTIMLTTFLVGIGIGSAIVAAIYKRSKTTSGRWESFGYVQVAIGLFGLISILMFRFMEPLDSVIAETFWENTGIQFVIAALIMIVPTTLMGAAFPIVCSIVSSDVRHVGGTVGDVYAANTIGALFGSFVTGFFMVRYLGTQNSIVFVSTVNFLIASLILLAAPGAQKKAGLLHRYPNLDFVALLWVIVVLGVLLVPRNYLYEYYNISEKRADSKVEILHADEGVEAITTVHRFSDGHRVISTGSVNVAGTTFTLRTTQMLQGHIPMLLHPQAKQVLQIGFGSGETAHIVTSYDNVERHDVVDINRSVIDSSAKYFRDINHDVVEDPKFHLTIMDGANYLRLTRKTYDVIMNDSIWPFYAGNSGLYTRDYFLAGKAHLNKGGFMTSWLPVEIAPEDYAILLNTFHSVFPHVSVWVAVTHYNKHALIIGSEEPIIIDVGEFMNRFQRFATDDLRVIKLDDPVSLLTCFRMDETGFSEDFMGSPVHTEDRPILEFSLSRGKPALGHVEVYDYFASHPTSVLPYLTNLPGDADNQEQFRATVAAAEEASNHVLRGIVKRERYDVDFVDEYRQALAVWPEHPGAKMLMGKITSLDQLDKNTFSGKPYNELGTIANELLKSGALENAVDVLKSMLHERPDQVEVLAVLGNVLVKLGRYDEGVQRLTKVNALEPSPESNKVLSHAHFSYGLQLVKQGRHRSAVVHFRESVRLLPDFSEARQNYASALAESGENAEAVSQFREVIRRKPSAIAYNNLGLLLARTGDLEGAIAQFTNAIELDPNFIQAREHLAYAYFNKEEYNNAWAEADHLREMGAVVNPSFLDALRTKLQ